MKVVLDDSHFDAPATAPDSTARFQDGIEPLHLAASVDSPETLKILVAAGASTDAKNDVRRTQSTPQSPSPSSQMPRV